ncbi:putative iron-regulated membrane protein [Actinomycetospora succinea]|uniref:Putative iron-regulated membrane protein n=1 Tax=Actinomycetospora succinea TaxID=663603 RepID=A0A4R6VRR5_9PSEU|nr:PepSY-associated TM helix domain-containing protein [Actinomycetospora succinea]TDQ62550.1 putative iron-regulated membrane protein [Actinomycetospora succinea]
MSDVTLDPPAPGAELPRAEASRPGGAAWWWRGLRPLVRRLHFYVGLFVGPFLFVAAFSGLLYTLSPQLDQVVYGHELRVPVAPTAPLDLGAQVRAAQAAVPDGTVTEVRPAPTADATTRVSFDAPGVREDFARTAFVDPYTGDVRGVLDTFGEWLPARAWIDEMHRTLFLGDVGRVYSELAASWLWVLALSGVALWVVRRRRARRVRRTLLPEASAPSGQRLRSWHGAVGLWATVGLLFLSATGLTWSQFAGENVSTLRTALDWSTPEVSQDLATGTPSTPLPVDATSDRVLAAARGAGLSNPVAITPADPGEAWVVSQVKRSWPEKQDSVSVDPATGQVLDVSRFADWPLAAKLAQWGIDAHMGLLFGWVSQVFLAALALGLMCMVAWGYRMWWKRRPTRGGLPGPPGGTQRPGVGAVLVVALVAIAVGLFLPVLGASLLVFLLADGVRQAVSGATVVRAG